MKHTSRLIFMALIFVFLAACAGQETRESAPVEDRGMESDEGVETIGTGEERGFQGHVLDDPDPDNLLYQKVVYFDLDQSTVKPEYRDVVRAHGQYLAAHPMAAVTLEGHADERGSREYNLGLGERRAEAVTELMMAFGADRSQITQVSYGEEQPVALCHDESCWSQNRRVVIIYTDRG